MVDLHDVINRLATSLSQQADDAGNEVYALSVVLLWRPADPLTARQQPGTGDEFRVDKLAHETGLVAHAFSYDSAGTCTAIAIDSTSLPVITQTREAAIAFDAADGPHTRSERAPDSEAYGHEDTTDAPLRGLVARFSTERNTVSLLYGTAADPWDGATPTELGVMARPLSEQISTGDSPVPRELLEHLSAAVLHDDVLDGRILDSVSVLVRRHDDDSIDLHAFAYPLETDPFLWTPVDAVGVASKIFQAADTATAQPVRSRANASLMRPFPEDTEGDLWKALEEQFEVVEGEPDSSAADRNGQSKDEPADELSGDQDDSAPRLRVLLVRFDIFADQMFVSMLGGRSAQEWFDDDIATAPQVFIDKARHVAADPGPDLDSVYVTEDGQRWLRPELVRHLMGIVLKSATQRPDADPYAIALIVINTPAGIEFCAFGYDENPHMLVPYGLDVPSLSGIFTENPGVTAAVIRARMDEQRMEALLAYGSDGRRWVQAFTTPEILAELARPQSEESEAAVQGLSEHLNSADISCDAGTRALLVRTDAHGRDLDGYWFVQPYESWATGEEYGWMWTGERHAVVTPDADVRTVAASLRDHE